MSRPRTTSFGLIRHSTTEWNKRKIIQGIRDSPLSRAGKTLAKDWGTQLAACSWQRIICSDLGRARETADLVNRSLRLPVSTDTNLREQDWGEWTGRTLAQLRARQNDLLQKQVRRGWSFTPPGGESRTEVLRRSLAALRTAHAAWPGEMILVICHEGVIKCILYHLSGRRFLPEEPRLLKPYHLHLVEQAGENPRIGKINSMELKQP